MSTLNWRCCVKNLEELKETTKILMRDKYDHTYVAVGEYNSESKILMSYYYVPVAKYRLLSEHYTHYEYVTIEEL